MMSNFTFYNPDYLYLLILVPLLWVWYFFRHKKQHTHIQVSSFNGISIKSWKSLGRHFLFLMRTLAIGLLIVAFARPQSTASWEDMITEGIDIVLALDISGSMLAQDLSPDRLEASKNVAMDFISGRPNDRIGLVIFSGESFTQCPLTTDHQVLQNLFKDVKSGMVEDGTAIGMGLATAVNRLKDSEAKEGGDFTNRWCKQPRIYSSDDGGRNCTTVQCTSIHHRSGTQGYAPYLSNTIWNHVYQDVEVKIDEQTLQDIASATNGKYFRATTNQALQKIYQEIDQMERSKIEVKEDQNKKEEFLTFALISLLLLLLEFGLKHTVFKSIT